MGLNALIFTRKASAGFIARIDCVFYCTFSDAPCTNKCTVHRGALRCMPGIAPCTNPTTSVGVVNGATVQGVGAVQPKNFSTPQPWLHRNAQISRIG